MDFSDDDLLHFAAEGTPPLPASGQHAYLSHAGARIWYATYGAGPAVVLLHGGLGHSGNWSYQVPALVAEGYRVVVIDSRGHGRSTRDEQPYSYDLMASDAEAVLDSLSIDSAAFVGWSDGACTALVLAARAPSRVRGVFYFACNMDPSGVRPFEPTPVVDRCFHRHTLDYAQLSPTPKAFQTLVDDLTKMQRTQPDFSAQQLAAISVPVVIAQSEHDEFIHPDHAAYLARTIPQAKLILLSGVSHFAPLQRPAKFNEAVLSFLRRTTPPA